MYLPYFPFGKLETPKLKQKLIPRGQNALCHVWLIFEQRVLKRFLKIIGVSIQCVDIKTHANSRNSLLKKSKFTQCPSPCLVEIGSGNLNSSKEDFKMT